MKTMNAHGRKEWDTLFADACVEVEVAHKVSLLVRRELGLEPKDAEAELRGGCLTVRLCEALTPMARLILQTEGGHQIVQGAYEALHSACRDRLETLVCRIVGLPVRRSCLALDASTEEVLLRFELSPEFVPGDSSRGNKSTKSAFAD